MSVNMSVFFLQTVASFPLEICDFSPNLYLAKNFVGIAVTPDDCRKSVNCPTMSEIFWEGNFEGSRLSEKCHRLCCFSDLGGTGDLSKFHTSCILGTRSGCPSCRRRPVLRGQPGVHEASALLSICSPDALFKTERRVFILYRRPPPGHQYRLSFDVCRK